MRGQRLQSRCKEPHGRRSRLSAIRDRQRHRLQRASDRRQRLGSEAHLWTQRLLGRGEQGQEGRGRLRKRDEEQPYGRHRHPAAYHEKIHSVLLRIQRCSALHLIYFIAYDGAALHCTAVFVAVNTA